ncbi:MAG: nucleotidyltransferase domain-containing protein [Myxococcota bacterium]
MARESALRRHVVVYLSGSHAYGFPSPDSDVDLKAVHLTDTRTVLGLAAPAPAVDRMEWLDGVELDYTSNELGQVLGGLLRGNGNYLERVLCPTVIAADEPVLARIRDLAPAFLSQRAHGHYRGFAKQQRADLERKPTVKRLLYVLRTLATGIWLLERGEVVADLPQLADGLGLDGVDALIARKRSGELAELDRASIEAWAARVDGLFARIDAARTESPLPADPAEPGALDALLVDVRLAAL